MVRLNAHKTFHILKVCPIKHRCNGEAVSGKILHKRLISKIINKFIEIQVIYLFIDCI